MIEAFRIGVRMTMDAADTQSAVNVLSRDFTALNQQITQTQNGLAAVRGGLADLAGQQTLLQRTQESTLQTATWPMASPPLKADLPLSQISPASDHGLPTAATNHVLSSEQGQGVTSAITILRAPVMAAAPAEYVQPQIRRESATSDAAMLDLPALATLLDRHESWSPRVAEAHKVSVQSGGGAEDTPSLPVLRDRSGSIQATVDGAALPGDRRWLEDFTARTSLTPRPAAVGRDSALLADWVMPRRDDRASNAIPPAQGQAGILPKTMGGTTASGEDAATSAVTLARHVAALASTVTGDTQATTTRLGYADPVTAVGKVRDSGPPLLPPDVAGRRPNGSATDRSASDHSGGGGRVVEEAISTQQLQPMVIHTDLHLDGEVIARAVSHQIVDWMNGPLPGAGGFDPRRSYTPVET